MSVERSYPSRAHWMANEGRSLFTNVTVAIARQLGRRPLQSSDGSLQSAARYVAEDDYVMTSVAVTGGLLESCMKAAVQPSAVLGGRSPIQVLEARRGELDRYADLAQFGDGVPGLLHNSLDFAFAATIRAADVAIGHSSLLPGASVSTYQSLVAMRAAMIDHRFASDVLEPLATAGFGIEGNGFILEVGSTPVFRFQEPGDLPTGRRGVHWTDEAEPSPYLDPELRNGLATTMRAAGRTSFIYRAGKSTDVTSSGCPVRRPLDRRDPEAMSAIEVTNYLMVLAIDQVELAFARTAAGKSAVRDGQGLA